MSASSRVIVPQMPLQIVSFLEKSTDSLGRVQTFANMERRIAIN
jgi:hypothetical protein